MEFSMMEQLKYFASPVHHLGTNPLVDGAPGVGRNAGASLSSDLQHCFRKDAGIADVCKGPHVLHSILRQRPTLRLKCTNLKKIQRFVRHATMQGEEELFHDSAAIIVNKRLTMDLRQLQSSTKGSPAARTAFRTLGPSSEPKRRLPISSTLLST